MSEHIHPEGTGGGHGSGPHVEAEPDKASYPWLMTVVGVFLALHLIGLVALWLFFQRQSEETVAQQVLTKPHLPLLELREKEQVELTTYGVVDRGQGLYRVPVEQGIGLYLDAVRAKAAAGEAMRIGPPVAAAAFPVAAPGNGAVPAAPGGGTVPGAGGTSPPAGGGT